MMEDVGTGLPETKKLWGLIFAIFVLATLGIVVWLKIAGQTPLPASIKSQLTFKFIYPTANASAIDAASYKYQAQPKLLNYTVHYNGVDVIFYEQPAPGNLGSDIQNYYPTLGIHPYAQFKTSQGTVALTRFWQAGNLAPFGQVAVMISNGTLITAHSDKNLTNQQWKSLFDSLKITG